MVFEHACQPRLEEQFYQTEEKRVEKYLAHNFFNRNNNYKSLDCVYSSKYLRLFIKKSSHNKKVEVSISKKFFKLAVERNKLKRRIKEICRLLDVDCLGDGVFVFSVFLFERCPVGETFIKVIQKKKKNAFDNGIK